MLQRFLCKGIELAITRISLDGCIKTISIERLKPDAKARQLSGRQFRDGAFNVLCGCHSCNIASVGCNEK